MTPKKRRGTPPRKRQGPSADPPPPWRLRFSERILAEDLGRIGHSAFARVRKAITKKLTVDPYQYGDGLRPPLDGIYKLKSSNVRVAYHIEEAAHEVWILMIGDRAVIWARDQAEILARLDVMTERPEP